MDQGRNAEPVFRIRLVIVIGVIFPVELHGIGGIFRYSAGKGTVCQCELLFQSPDHIIFLRLLCLRVD